MTLQMKGVEIAGLPALTIRNMLRRVGERLDPLFMAERCKVPRHRAKEIIKILVAEGYLEFAERSKRPEASYRSEKEKRQCCSVDYYKLTRKGIQLVRGSAMGKIPRAKAQQIINGLMDRVEEVNLVADYLYRISAVILFGS